MSVDSFNNFIDKWITPATIMVAIGAIIWGVQLNIATLQQGERIGVHDKAIDRLQKQQYQLENQMVRVSTLLDSTAKRLEVMEERAREHEREVKQMERQIIRNYETLRNNNREKTE